MHCVTRLDVLLCISLTLTFPILAMSQTQPPQNEWQTWAEKTDYRETPRYNETISYSRKLAAATDRIEYRTFGNSGQGRDLPLLVAAEGQTFTPDAARKAAKAVVLIQACIHAGEPDGKDAGLALLRDMAITRTRAELLKSVVVLFIPIYNTDGHERFGPFNRINQNGPAEMGWRGTSTNLNLNRDYMKADAPETKAWLELWNEWSPDLFIDCHVTNGADYRYNITYHFEHHEGIPATVFAWEREVIEGRVVPAVEAAGNLVSWYLQFRDNRDFTKGIRDFSGSPRFSTGYTPLRNRPGLLLETHMLKDYRSRVRGTYDFLRFALAEVNRDPAALVKAGRAADDAMLAEPNPKHSYPLAFELTDKSVPFLFKTVEHRTELSDVSGAVRIIFGTRPLDMTVPMYNTFRVKAAAALPVCYVVPPQWEEVIGVLRAHGLRLLRLTEATSIGIESYRFTEVKWPAASFEGRFMPTFKANSVREMRLFPADSILIPMKQPLARLAANLLEPEAPDSLLAWGFFNPIFEQKEFAESYVLEKLAREMLAKDPALRKEFESSIANDPPFAGSAQRRLQFFYRRSPYWDQQLNLYPVGRIIDRVSLPSEPFK